MTSYKLEKKWNRYKSHYDFICTATSSIGISWQPFAISEKDYQSFMSLQYIEGEAIKKFDEIIEKEKEVAKRAEENRVIKEVEI